jgi:hypothetical protein
VRTAGAQLDALKPFAEVVQGVIQKPFDVHELREIVQRYVFQRPRHDGLPACAAEVS